MKRIYLSLTAFPLFVLFVQPVCLVSGEETQEVSVEQEQGGQSESKPWLVGERVTSLSGELDVLKGQNVSRKIKVKKDQLLTITAVEPTRIKVFGLTANQEQFHEWVFPQKLKKIVEDSKDQPEEIQKELRRLNKQANKLFESKMSDIESSNLGQEIDSAIESYCIKARSYAYATKGYWTNAEEKVLQTTAEGMRQFQLSVRAWSTLNESEKITLIKGGLFTGELLQVLLEYSPLETSTNSESAKLSSSIGN